MKIIETLYRIFVCKLIGHKAVDIRKISFYYPWIDKTRDREIVAYCTYCDCVVHVYTKGKEIN